MDPRQIVIAAVRPNSPLLLKPGALSADPYTYPTPTWNRMHVEMLTALDVLSSVVSGSYATIA